MKKAFTLVELLIVIVIIGILATMAVPLYQKMVDKARWAEPRIMMDNIRKMELVYYMQYGEYADCGSGVDPNWAWEKIGIDSPNANPNRKFTYDVLDDIDSSKWFVKAVIGTVISGTNNPYILMYLTSGQAKSFNGAPQ